MLVRQTHNVARCGNGPSARSPPRGSVWLAQRWADMDAWTCEALPATPPSRTEGAMLTDSSRLCKKSGRKTGGGSREEEDGSRRRSEDTRRTPPGNPGLSPKAVECAAAHSTAFQQKRVLVARLDIARSISIATPHCTATGQRE